MTTRILRPRTNTTTSRLQLLINCVRGKVDLHQMAAVILFFIEQAQVEPEIHKDQVIRGVLRTMFLPL